MWLFQRKMLWTAIMVFLMANARMKGVSGIRFLIDKEECFSHKIEFPATVRFSFVVIQVYNVWNAEVVGVDLVVKGPKGEQIHDIRDKTSDKYDFVAHDEGLYQFCFGIKSTLQEIIDFSVHTSHLYNVFQHAKDDHFNPILEQISKLEDALNNIQFEQHWLEAESDRQTIIMEAMSKRAMHKAIFESTALVSASVLQVYLLKRLFKRKLGMSRV